MLISRNQKTPIHNLLHACAVAGHSNQVAVWLDLKNLRHAKEYREKLPKRCWLR